MDQKLFNLHEYLDKHVYIKVIATNTTVDHVMKQCSCGAVAWVLGSIARPLGRSWEVKPKLWDKKYQKQSVVHAVREHFKLIKNKELPI